MMPQIVKFFTIFSNLFSNFLIKNIHFSYTPKNHFISRQVPPHFKRIIIVNNFSE